MAPGWEALLNSTTKAQYCHLGCQPPQAPEGPAATGSPSDAEGQLKLATTVSLDQLPEKARGVVRRLTGGHQLVSRLASMGLAEDAAVVVLQNSGYGPVLVLVRDTRLALGRGEAAKVLVEQCPT
jgi:ferrous iron transport protein A